MILAICGPYGQFGFCKDKIHLSSHANIWDEGLGKAYDNLGYYTKISLLGGLRKREKSRLLSPVRLNAFVITASSIR
jgi:hypothetical protein